MFSLIPFTDSWATVVIYPPAIFSAKACSVFVTQLRCPWTPGWFHYGVRMCNTPTDVFWSYENLALWLFLLKWKILR